MAKRNEIFPSKYLKVGDLNGKPHVVAIGRAPTETVGKGDDKETKTVLYFRGDILKPLPLNMTNWDSVALVTGEDDTVNWRGHYVELYPDKTYMNGKVVDCIRIRAPKKDMQLESTTPKARPPTSDNNDMNDDIPF